MAELRAGASSIQLHSSKMSSSRWARRFLATSKPGWSCHAKWSVPLPNMSARRPVGARTFRDVIARTYNYVSVEMIVSGRWLMPVYEAICELEGVTPEDLSPQNILDRADAGDKVCVEVCKFRANALMGAVGDAALITGAHAGVVLTGGVAERMVKWLRTTEASDRFLERGPMSPFLAHTPVSVLMHDEAPLIGAAALALE